MYLALLAIQQEQKYILRHSPIIGWSSEILIECWTERGCGTARAGQKMKPPSFQYPTSNWAVSDVSDVGDPFPNECPSTFGHSASTAFQMPRTFRTLKPPPSYPFKCLVYIGTLKVQCHFLSTKRTGSIFRLLDGTSSGQGKSRGRGDLERHRVLLSCAKLHTSSSPRSVCPV
jgi:hypothetical protein